MSGTALAIRKEEISLGRLLTDKEEAIVIEKEKLTQKIQDEADAEQKLIDVA